jgi:hypothetical protein
MALLPTLASTPSQLHIETDLAQLASESPTSPTASQSSFLTANESWLESDCGSSPNGAAYTGELQLNQNQHQNHHHQNHQHHQHHQNQQQCAYPAYDWQQEWELVQSGTYPGRYYYQHKNTGATQWHCPQTEAAGQALTPTTNPAVHVGAGCEKQNTTPALVFF